MKLEVRSKSEKGMRRAGRFWGPDPVEVEVEDDVATKLFAEKALAVRRLDGGPPPKSPAPVNVTPEPHASGLEDGLRHVPSDLNDGKPVVDESVMPRRKTTTTTTVPERPSFVLDDPPAPPAGAPSEEKKA